MSDDYIKAMADDMVKTIDSLKRELLGVRTGRASPALVENLQVAVQSYGSTMPLRDIAGITAPDPRMIVVNPWDKGTIQDIERAIATAGLGFNPSNDGVVVRIPIPPLTGDRRQGLVKIVKQHAEEARVRVRAVRREYNELLKSLKDEGELTEDQLTRSLDKVQKSTDEHVKKVDDICAAKEKEVLEV
jgi:ribosome recycling factor